MAKKNQKAAPQNVVKAVDGVEVEWLEAKNAKDEVVNHFNEVGSTSMVHRVQAEKLAKKGFVRIVEGGETETFQKVTETE